jgi:ubiquinol-cytochrome c reductase cytochrome b subunit
MFLMPILGRWNLGHRFNVVFTLAVLCGAGLLTAMALHEDYYALWADRSAYADVEQLLNETGGDPQKLTVALGNDASKQAVFEKRRHEYEAIRKSEAFLVAVKQAKADAERAIELAGRPEKIPPTGALALIRQDPLSQGPRLFAQHCASCHAHVDPAAAEAEAVLAKSSAANLFEFGGLSWARGLLDPAQVAGPAYFGNTAHKDGDMVSFVTDDLSDTETWKPAEVKAVIVALAAEAGLPTGGAAAGQVKKGRELMADTDRCGSCHAYGDNETELGYAPDLNGWGSREWLVGIITDPTHQRFYPDTNDRMPSFGVGRDGGTPTLSAAEIGLLADWLRGSWYRPAASVHETAGVSQ